MKYSKHSLLLVFGMISFTSLSPISMVYNFRIAQITKQPIFEKADQNNCTLIGLIFEQYRKKYNNIYQNFAGALSAFIYDFESYYFRTDVAFSNIRERTCLTSTFSGTETDDILFTLGRNFIINNHVSVTCSGLFGIPTHRIYRLQHTDFGYSQIGLGVQFDGIYVLKNGTLLYGARYINFIPKDALDNLEKKHLFTIGNVADLLFAYKNYWGKHGLEVGYTARSRFGADIYPELDDIVKKTNYIRSNFYLVYKYKFLINDIKNRLLFNISYGRDHRSKLFGNQYIITLWASWNIGF